MAEKKEHEEIGDPIENTYYEFDPQRVKLDLTEWLKGGE